MNLQSLRPTNGTSAALAEALARAKATQATAQADAAQAKAARDSLLLDGDAKQLAAAEKALADARGDGERVDAIVTELSNRLTSAKRAEDFSRIRDALERRRTAQAARLAWWKEHGPQIQAAVRTGYEFHDAAERALREIRDAERIVVARYGTDPERHAEATAELNAIFEGKPDLDENSDAWRFDEKIADWCIGNDLGEEVK